MSKSLIDQIRPHHYLYNALMEKINKLLKEEMDKRMDPDYKPKTFYEITENKLK